MPLHIKIDHLVFYVNMLSHTMKTKMTQIEVNRVVRLLLSLPYMIERLKISLTIKLGENKVNKLQSCSSSIGMDNHQKKPRGGMKTCGKSKKRSHNLCNNNACSHCNIRWGKSNNPPHHHTTQMISVIKLSMWKLRRLALIFSFWKILELYRSL